MGINYVFQKKWIGLKYNPAGTFLLRAGVIYKNVLAACLPETQIFVPPPEALTSAVS